MKRSDWTSTFHEKTASLLAFDNYESALYIPLMPNSTPAVCSHLAVCFDQRDISYHGNNSSGKFVFQCDSMATKAEVKSDRRVGKQTQLAGE